MYKYDGLLVHQFYDDDGVLEVVEQDGVRALHFGTSPRQSCMSLSDPDKLELDYVRAMTSWLLFKPDLVDDVLMIGLGGGSLTSHLLRNFCKCRLRVIEYRKAVVKIARSHFNLPSDPRLKIIIDDGGHYVCQRTESLKEHYSLLFIDAFDHDSMASSVCNEAFFAAAKQLLKNDGILVINLWGGFNNPLFVMCRGWLEHVFNSKILFLPVRNRSNIIGLAFNDDCPVINISKLKIRAIELEQQYQIEYTIFLKNLRRYNPDTFKYVASK